MLRVRTQRRQNAEAGVNLRKRRAWYSDGEDATDKPSGADAPPGDNNDEFDFDLLPPPVQNHIKGLRSEAKGYRIDKRELEQKLGALEGRLTTAEKARKDDLERKNDYETLSREQELEIADFKLQAEEGLRYRESVEASNSHKIGELPDHLKELATDLVKDLSPDKMQAWLNKHAKKLTAPVAPNLDGGAGGMGSGGQTATRLTSDEKNLARQMRMTDDEYAAAKKQMQ